MNKADFISLIEQPEILGENHIPALKNIAADFPYFQGAQLLLTKALYNEKHYEFEKQLKYASLMVPDRAVLFRYIHNLTEAAVQQAFETPVVVQEKEAVAETVLKDVEGAELVVTEPEAAEELITEPETIAETPIENVKLPEIVVEETPAFPETITEPEVLAIEVPQPVEEPAIETVTEPVPEMPVVVETPVNNEPEKVVAETLGVSTVEPSTNETHSFMEWLQLQADHATRPAANQVIEAPVEQVTQPEEIKEETPRTETMREEIAGQVERSSNVTEFESILDKFIRENPKISRGKAEFYSPVNMAKQSVEQDEELVTETLANIYYKQGHYKKAIRAYEKLCLLYPHKLPYFADLIQKIKTENKD